VLDPQFKDQLFINSPDFFDDIWLSECKTSLLKMMDDQEENTVAPIPAKASNVPMASLLLKNAQKLLGPALVSSTGKETVQQELARYVANADLPIDGCILLWWKLNQAVYPQLAKVVRNVLAIPGEFTGISMPTIADCIAQGGSVIVEHSLSGG